MERKLVEAKWGIPGWGHSTSKSGTGRDGARGAKATQRAVAGSSQGLLNSNRGTAARGREEEEKKKGQQDLPCVKEKEGSKVDGALLGGKRRSAIKETKGKFV